MPVTLRYDKEKKILYATPGKQITPDDFADTLKEITRSNEYPPDVGILWDLRMLNMPDINDQFQSNLIEIRKQFPERGNAKVALIVSTSYLYGMSRMYQILSEVEPMPQNMMVFKNLSEGEAWLLGVEE